MEQKRKYIKPSMKAMKIDSSNMIMSSGVSQESPVNGGDVDTKK